MFSGAHHTKPNLLPPLLTTLGKLTVAYGLSQWLKRFSQQLKRKSKVQGTVWRLLARGARDPKLLVKTRAPFAGSPNRKPFSCIARPVAASATSVLSRARKNYQQEQVIPSSGLHMRS